VIQLKSIHPREDMKVTVLGLNIILPWRTDVHGMTIEIPAGKPGDSKFPCVIKFEYPRGIST
jgi:hypothetical protein